MLPLWDMITRAQNGQGAEILAKQFALSQAQMQAAIDALLPAFSAGLKRNAADPYGFSALLKAVGTGGYAKYFDDAARALSPQGMADGNTILNQIFGSEELSRAVAAQAAQATGLGQELLKQMLPVLAAMMAGGFFKQFSGALGQGGNPFAEAAAAMMRNAGAMTGTPQQQGTQPPSNPFGEMFANNPWSKAFGEMWGVPKSGEAAQAGSQAAAGNPFLAMSEQWMRSMSAAAAPAGSEAPPPPANPMADALNGMFETGRKQRDDYLRGMDQLFEQFAKSGTKSA